MSWSWPPAWEDVLWQAARRELSPDATEVRHLLPAIAERTRLYTTDRDRLHAAAGPRNDRDLAARALFFTVADATKVAIPVAELSGRGLIPAREPLRVLDWGAGVGAMSLGLAAALPGRPLSITAVDRDGRALALFARVAQLLDAPLELETAVADIRTSPVPGRFDVILAGSVLNELGPDEHLPQARRLLASLAPDGALIVIEPALRETARALHGLRDAILSGSLAHVFAPCTRTAARCPALDDPRDWCHEDRAFHLPPRLQMLAEKTGLRRQGLKFAYLTLRLDPTPQVEEGGSALRVVSDPLDQKGTIERIVCSDSGRVRLRVLRRERTQTAAALARAERGDVLVETPDQSMTRIRPAGR